MTSSGSCEYAKNDRMCAISLSNPSRTLPSSAGVSERAIAIRKALMPISSAFLRVDRRNDLVDFVSHLRPPRPFRVEAKSYHGCAGLHIRSAGFRRPLNSRLTGV
uniref:Uncharacterized protein n=1 Tax=Pseudomonas phage PACT201 TaxID=3230130 RepID=A0AAU8GSE6_9VIRU